MSEENIEKFYTKLGEDKALQKRVTEAAEGLKQRFKEKETIGKNDFSEAFAILEPFAREYGFPFTLADLEKYGRGRKGQLPDEQLSAVVGGVGACACPAVGAGMTGDGCPGGACYCVAIGIGSLGVHASSQYYCVCVAAGGGGCPDGA